MTYVMIRVHSFACDAPDCPEEYEDADYYKRQVWKTITRLGWTRTKDGQYYCPKHRREEVMPDDSVVERNRDSTRRPVTAARAAVPVRAKVRISL